MVVTGTREAFERLINQTGIYKKLGVSTSTISIWKSQLESGKGISLDKMEEVLLSVNGRVVQEKVWDVNILKGKDTFTIEEIEAISKLIERIRSVGSVLQKKLRRQLREEYDFFISDFEDTNGFTLDDLQRAISEGMIKIDQ